MKTTLQSFVPKNGTYTFYQHGTWVESVTHNLIDIISPADESVVGRVQAMASLEAQHSLKDSFDTFPAWSETTVDERATIIEKAADIVEENAELLIHIVSWEVGKVYEEAKAEVHRTAKIMRYYAQAGRQIHNDA